MIEQIDSAQPRRIVTLPARLTRWKGQDAFIELIASLRRRHPDVNRTTLALQDAKGHVQHQQRIRQIDRQV